MIAYQQPVLFSRESNRCPVGFNTTRTATRSGLKIVQKSMSFQFVWLIPSATMKVQDQPKQPP